MFRVGPMRSWNSGDRAWQTDWKMRIGSFKTKYSGCPKRN